MFDFLQPVVDVFNFIVSILQTIINGIYGVVSIIGNIIKLILSLCRILPDPLYSTFWFLFLFMVLYSFIKFLGKDRETCICTLPYIKGGFYDLGFS